VNSYNLIALANHLWQSTLFAVAAGGLTLLLRNNSARARYSLWLAASVKFLVPFGLLIAVGARIPWSVGPVPGKQPFFISMAGQMAAPITRLGGHATAARAQVSGTGSHGDLVLIALGTLWVLGGLLVAARWASRWSLVRRAMRESTETNLTFVVPVRSSSLQLEPAVVGVLRPVLLLPQGMERHLAPEEMRAVLAHERCHVAWRDNLAAALHMAAETLFWFHPLIWWLGTRLVKERERACDEQVLADGHSPESYAESILKVCEHYLASRVPCVAGVSGADLRGRIEGIMRHRSVDRLGFARKLMIALAAVATIAVPVAVGLLTSPRVRAEAEGPASDGPAFRNVSIRISTHRTTPFGFCGGIWITPDIPAGRAAIGCPSLRDFIANVYGVSRSQVVGQDWSKVPDYDITADDPLNAQDRAAMWRSVPTMTRNLLAKQFGLVVQPEQRAMDGYVLSIGSAGSKLKPYPGGPSWKTAAWMSPDEGFDVTDYPIGALTDFLQRTFNMPVVDQTGLQGHYEYKAVWKSSVQGEPADPAIVAKALEDQLGLRLEAKRVTVDVIHVTGLKSPEDVVTRGTTAPGRTSTGPAPSVAVPAVAGASDGVPSLAIPAASVYPDDSELPRGTQMQAPRLQLRFGPEVNVNFQADSVTTLDGTAVFEGHIHIEASFPLVHRTPSGPVMTTERRAVIIEADKVLMKQQPGGGAQLDVQNASVKLT
jgi:uncharacterized protein (TIGR03435 family)